MLTYVIRRLLYSIVVLFAASIIIFTFVTVSGRPARVSEDAARHLASRRSTNIEERKHLDRLDLRSATATGSRTPSRTSSGPTIDQRHADPSRSPAGDGAHAPARRHRRDARGPLAVGIGVYSALRQYSAFDYTATTFSFVGLAIPVFWLALMLQVLFVNDLHSWFDCASSPSRVSARSIRDTASTSSLDRAWHLALPMMVLMVASIATYSRYMRASMLEVVNADYVRTARAKGLSESRVTMRHAFRNALIPLVTLVALNFGALLGGAVVTETVFALDGMGLYFINALNAGDPYPVMAWLMVTASMIIIFNLIADIAYGYLDPRVRYD